MKNSLITYIIKNYPVLNSQQTRALCDRIRQGDIEARNELALHNIRLILKEIAQMHLSEDDADDLFQECFITYMQKARKYDPDKGAFSTYMVPWIQDTIRVHNPRRIPVKALSDYYKIDKVKADYLNEFERLPTEEELARDTGLTLRLLRKRISDGDFYFMESLDRNIRGDDGGYTPILALTPSVKYSDPEAEYIAQESCEELLRFLKKLTKEELLVLDCLYNLSGKFAKPLSAREAERVTGIGRMKIARYRDSAMAKLRMWFDYGTHNNGKAA